MAEHLELVPLEVIEVRVLTLSSRDQLFRLGNLDAGEKLLIITVEDRGEHVSLFVNAVLHLLALSELVGLLHDIGVVIGKIPGHNYQGGVLDKDVLHLVFARVARNHISGTLFKHLLEAGVDHYDSNIVAPKGELYYAIQKVKCHIAYSMNF